MKYIKPLNDDAYPERLGAYVNANPSLGIPGSTVPGEALQHTMTEIINAITAAGLTPDDADLTQLLQGITSEFYLTNLTPTYVAPAQFSVAGDQTAIFTRGRVLKITDTGGTVYVVVSASVYDTVTTVTIAGDVIDSGISKVLYSINQKSSGIWESGSNDNGWYRRFCDGTQICGHWFLQTPAAKTTLQTVWTFPAEFYVPSGDDAIAHIAISATLGGTDGVAIETGQVGLLISSTDPVTSTYCKVYHYNGHIATNTITALMSAIGRWY